jgi:hypothetical protein
MKNVIVLINEENSKKIECWGSLKKVCDEYRYSYNWLKTKKMPFSYKGWCFYRIPFDQVGEQ